MSTVNSESHELICCARLSEQSQTAPPQRHRRFTGMGFFALFIAATALVATNNAVLWAMNTSVQEQVQQAEESKKPAEITVTAVVSPNCARCYPVTKFVSGLTQNDKVKITDARTVDYASAEGQTLVSQYGLDRIPAVVVQGQTAKLLATLPSLTSYGRLQNDDFVGSSLPAPYLEIASNKIRGDFDITYITEKSCPTCYQPSVNRAALAQLGLVPVNEKTIDRSDGEGKDLVKQYNLTTTPSIILTGDLAAYAGFDTIWTRNVGTIEPDGTYVFRQGQSLMGTYFDLTTNKTVNPKTESNANTNTNPATNE